MNLLDEKWIPVRRANGQQDWISPSQMSEPDIVALDARRPDFNGALIQFLIGLIQTNTPMDSETEWEEWDKGPPSIEVLQQWFAPVRDAFVFDGNGARFMQDFELRTEGMKEKELNGVSALLIEAPGENTLKENKDHFIKRDGIEALCLHCTATALFTLQTNAPSGGQGHNTSIRGGGPLTTLIKGGGNSLWHLVWLNIKPRSQFLSATGDQGKDGLQYIFPWVGAMSDIQTDGGQLTPIQVHPAHAFWGMPRRIRLDLDRVSQGACDCCERVSSTLVIWYATKPKGLDYKGGWLHPLSPHYENKPGEMFPLHPQPGGIGYKHWLAWLLGVQGVKKMVQPASIISYVLESARLRGKQYRLWAFGYDMDNMKARCWYESALPLYGLVERNIDGLNFLQREIERWLKAADFAVFYLRRAVFSAWFSNSSDSFFEKDSEVSEGKDSQKKIKRIDDTFWTETEKAFYLLLKQLIEQARVEDDTSVLLPLREQWRNALVTTAEKLFEADFIGVAPIEQQNPRRTAEAFKRFRASLRGDKLKKLLDLPIEKPEKPRKQSAESAA